MAINDQYVQPVGTSGYIDPFLGGGSPSILNVTTSPSTVVTPKLASTYINGVSSGLADITTGLTNQQVANSATAASNLTAQQYADRAGVDVSRVQGSMGNYTIGPTPPPNQDDTLKQINTALSGTEPTTPEPTDTYQAQLQKSLADEEAQWNQTQQQLNQIRSGTFPLTADQQAQLDAVQRQFDILKEQQKVANKAYEGGTGVAEIASGRSEHFREISQGNVAAAVNVGIQKLADLDSQAANTISKLRQGFQTDNYKMIQDAWINYEKFQTDRNNVLKDIHDATTQAQKDLRDARHQELQDKLASDQFSYKQKQDEIDNAFKVGQMDLQERQFLQKQLDDNRNYGIRRAELNLKEQEAEILKAGASGQAGYITDQVISRRIDIDSPALTKEMRAMVINELNSRGLPIPRPLTTKEKDAASDATSGLAAIDELRKIYKDKGAGILLANSAPGIAGRWAGASKWRDMLGEVTDIKTRIRTGAALNESEEAFYAQQAPQLGDTPQDVEYKLNQLEGFYLGMSGIPVTISDGEQEFTFPDLFDPNQRLALRKAINDGATISY